jgi:hypothetical protein
MSIRQSIFSSKFIALLCPIFWLISSSNFVVPLTSSNHLNVNKHMLASSIRLNGNGIKTGVVDTKEQPFIVLCEPFIQRQIVEAC